MRSEMTLQLAVIAEGGRTIIAIEIFWSSFFYLFGHVLLLMYPVDFGGNAIQVNRVLESDRVQWFPDRLLLLIGTINRMMVMMRMINVRYYRL